MTTVTLAPDTAGTWFPIGRSDDAPRRHVHQAKLLGRELAVWRADDGFLNVWENRCLHRGVRLSTGLNEGTELKCMYHGWRYASRSAGCTYIPAHPADAPAQTICNRTFPCLEMGGLIWTCLDGSAGDSFGEPPAGEPVALLAAGDWFNLRSLPFNASPAIILETLAQYVLPWLEPVDSETDSGVEATMVGSYGVRLSTRSGDSETRHITLLVQPMDSYECVVHSVTNWVPDEGTATNILREHASELERLRDLAETWAASEPRPAAMTVALEHLEPNQVGQAGPRSRSEAELRVVVDRKWQTAAEIVGFELAAIDGHLPAAQPGAHIDVHLPNGLVRQYSLTNGSGDNEHYTIGVKREPNSRGGSSCLHDTVREGDVLAISAPRNNFTLRRDADHTILIAGGIGLTPLLAMAQTLQLGGHPYTLQYFAQSGGHLAFADRLDRLGHNLSKHLGRSPSETRDVLKSILRDPGDNHHVYVCGPGPMLDGVRALAGEHGWPESAVHFEYFKNTEEIDDTRAFQIHLARSGRTLDVPAGTSVLEVLREAGVVLPSSCEQGACGTCIVGVINGEVHHQDVYLRPSEHDAGDRMATCVSRARFDELTLDL